MTNGLKPADPSEERDQGIAPTLGERPRRKLVLALIALASVLLVLSMVANWVQRALLDTDQVADNTGEILADEDVEQQLSIYAVDQVYANVDVQGEIARRLPPSVEPLAAPAAAAARRFATDIAERALASPQVQDLVTDGVRGAHEQFVSLIRHEGEYVATTDGEVTLDYGSVVADLASRLGVDPAAISNVQAVAQDFSGELRERLTAAQSEIDSIRGTISQAQEGELNSEFQQRLETLGNNVTELQGNIAGLEKKIRDASASVPDQLRSPLTDLDARLADLDGRLTEVRERTTAVLTEPGQANTDALDASLASLETRISDLLAQPVVESPGELVVMTSTQLDGLQTLVRALRNLGFLLPLIVLLLYVVALYLAKGWRRQALIAAGGGILTATLLVLLARRLIGTQVIEAAANSETVEPAIRAVWDVISEGLRERALFVLVIGLAFVGGGLLAGPGRPAIATRRQLAPSLRDRPVAVYFVAAALVLLWLAFIPGIDNLGQVLVIVLLAMLAVVGIEALRRQTMREFPPRQNGS